MIVLGIHCGHDSSCAVIKDGQVIADGFPHEASLLRLVGATLMETSEE